MIDSMKLIDLSKYTQNGGARAKRKKRGQSRSASNEEILNSGSQSSQNVSNTGGNPFIRWMITIGRDYKMVLWKLVDGMIMHTDLALPLFIAQQETLNKAARKQNAKGIKLDDQQL